jgi:two-component system, NarL family, nitrate/nitrite response regulator NarL
MPSASAPDALLLSPHPLALEALRAALLPLGVRVIGVRLPHSAHPDLSQLAAAPGGLVVIDACYPPVGAERVVALVMGAVPAARALVLTDGLDETLTFRLLRLGVKGLVPYERVAEQLAPALQAVAKGGFWVPREMLSRFVDSLLQTGAARHTLHPAGLSSRENDVLDYLLENLSNKEIAARLSIAERTVKFHVSNLLGKFGVQRRADLILQAYQARSMEPARV